MPFGDGTGPQGLGPMTGRAAGRCAGFPVPGFMNRGMGRGMGWGRGLGRGYGMGRGRGWRWRQSMVPMALPTPVAGAPMPDYGDWSQVAAPSAEQEAQVLKAQAQQLQTSLDEIRRRLTELEAAPQERENPS